MTPPLSWPAPAGASLVPTESRQRRDAMVTLLFTDIESSARHWEEQPAMSVLVERHFDLLREAIAAHGGTIFSMMGDGVAAAFASVSGAVHAAIAAQHDVAPLGFAVRMGIHAGEVEQVGHDLRGRTVNRAARVMSTAQGGQILLSDVAAALVRGSARPVELVDRGVHMLRGLPEPEHLWQVAVTGDELDAPQPIGRVEPMVTNLPLPRSSLVGRSADVWRVRGAAAAHRIVTVVGPGGIGKTRLALEAAAEVAGGERTTWFVDLSHVTVADNVGDVVGAAVGMLPGLAGSGAPGPDHGSPPALLVIDNCEHVVAAAAAAVDRLLTAHPALTVIATSRRRLAVDGEHVVVLRPLDPDAAFALFCERAESAGAELGLVTHSMIERLCRRLEGVPLAIELAAARVASLGVPAVLELLDDRLAALADRGSGGGRHRTLGATIDWSYRLLDADQQRLFRWLSVFRNGFEIDAVRSVAEAQGLGPGLAAEQLTSLVAHSLLTPHVSADHVRYRMLEAVREFAAARLAESGEADQALSAHAAWVIGLTERVGHDICTAAVERNAVRLEREADNWRTAVATAIDRRSPEMAARLCGPATAFFLLGRHDLGDVVRPLLELCTRPADRRAVLSALVVSASGATDPAQVVRWVDEIEAVEADDPTGLGGLMRWIVLAWSGDFDGSVALCARSSDDERFGPATRDLFLGIAVLDQFSLTAITDDLHQIVPRALDVADRADMALTRATCLLGAAWAVAEQSPDWALELIGRALEVIPRAPALARLALPGNASRLLSRLAPDVAARGFLDQLDALPSRRAFVDLIPLLYALEFLRSGGQLPADVDLASVPVGPSAASVSMMDFVDLARRASRLGSPAAVSRLEDSVRRALCRIASAA
jgi:predicted ATPase/class 3 adenylate cyclase